MGNIGKKIQFIDDNKVLVGTVLSYQHNQYYTIVNNTEYLINDTSNIIIF